MNIQQIETNGNLNYISCKLDNKHRVTIQITDDFTGDINQYIEDEFNRQIAVFNDPVDLTEFKKVAKKVFGKNYKGKELIDKRPKFKTTKTTKEVPVIELIDGVAVQKIKVVDVDENVFNEYPVVDENGDPVLDKNGDQLIHKVPVME